LLATRFKTALVTGAAGFVGSHIVDSLLEAGLTVVALDDYSAGKPENLAHHDGNPRLSSYRRDVTEIDSIRELFSGVDIVFHEACSKNTVSFADPARDLAVNAEGTLNVLICARDAGVKKFVHASTGSVYGEATYFPTDELHPTKPAGYYGVSKLAGEQYVRVFSDLYGLDTIILRYYHVFGPRQDYSDVGGVVSIFARRAIAGEPLIIFGDGTQMRSFTYVKDIVALNEHVACLDGISGEAFNCASGVQVTIHELAKRVLEFYGRQDLEIIFEDWKPGDIVKFDVSNAKIRNTGFNFNYGFDEGLRLTLEASGAYFAQTLRNHEKEHSDQRKRMEAPS
jgi:nucleoside-diphosphate-sugar epimerase